MKLSKKTKIILAALGGAAVLVFIVKSRQSAAEGAAQTQQPWAIPFAQQIAAMPAVMGNIMSAFKMPETT